MLRLLQGKYAELAYLEIFRGVELRSMVIVGRDDAEN
jgi:hypothetical protein